jgi:hypothetical protein
MNTHQSQTDTAKKTPKNNTITITPSLAAKLPATILKTLKEMDPVLQQSFEEDYVKKSKSKVAAVFLAIFSCHYIYFGNFGRQVLFWITMGGFGFWWIWDLTQVSSWVDDHNKDTAMKILRDLKFIH